MRTLIMIAVLLTLPAFADESVTVTGSRIPGGGDPTPPMFQSNGSAPGKQQPQFKQRPDFEPGSGFTMREPTNAQILVMVMEQWRETVDQLARVQAWGELDL